MMNIQFLKKPVRDENENTLDPGGTIALQMLFLINSQDFGWWRQEYSELCELSTTLTIDSDQIGSDLLTRQEYASFLYAYWCPKSLVNLDVCWKFLEGNLEQEQWFLLNLLSRAVTCPVQYIGLTFFSPDIFEPTFVFPANVYECKSLVKLFLDGIVVALPPTTGIRFDSIRVLKFKWVKVQFENFGEWISEVFVRLQELTIGNIRGLERLNLSSSTLKKLFIDDRSYGTTDLRHFDISATELQILDIMFIDGHCTNSSLSLLAPNLNSMGLHGSFFSRYRLGKFSNLKIASLYAEHIRGEEHITNRSLKDIVAHVCDVESLISNGYFLKLLLARNFNFRTFRNVRSLQVSTAKDCKFGTIAPFIASLPILDSLEIKLNVCCNFPAAIPDQIAECPPMPPLTNLKKVEIQLARGINEFEVIKHFIRYSRELRTMKIYVPHQDFDLSTIINEISGFLETCTSTAEITVAVRESIGVVGDKRMRNMEQQLIRQLHI